MKVTFTKEFLIGTNGRPSMLPADMVRAAVDIISKRTYGGNVICEAMNVGPRTCRFTLATRDSKAYGSRTSHSGRHMRKASWEAHRDILREIFTADTGATIRSAMATYRGLDGFEREFPATAYKNIGSQVAPCTMPECSI